MRGLIQSHLKGLVTDINFFEGNVNILSFTVAGRSPFTKADDTEGHNYTYQRCKAFGLYANRLKDLLEVATPVEVFGQVRRRNYKNAQDEDRVDVSVTVNKVLLLDGQFDSYADSKGQLIMENCINQTSLVGNLVRDVKYRSSKGSTSVANATLAVNTYYGDQDYVTYLNFKAFGEQADAIQAATKGQPLSITGRIASEGYKNEEGENRYHTFIQVTEASTLKVLNPQDTQLGGVPDIEEIGEISDISDITEIDESFQPEETVEA